MGDSSRWARQLPSLALARWLRAGVALALAVLVVAIVALWQPSSNDLLAAGNAAQFSLRYDRALSWYARAHTLAPSDPRPLCDAAKVLVLQQEWSASAASYAECLARDESDGAHWVAYGDVLLQSGQDASARQAWSRAASIGDENGWRHLATDLEQHGELSAASATWGRLPRDDAEAQYHLGLLALASGAVDVAASHLRRAAATPAYRDRLAHDGFLSYLVAAPSATDPVRLGYLLLAADMPWLAVPTLERAVAAEPANGEAHAYLGWALWLNGRQVEARTNIAEGLRLAPKDDFVLYAAAQVVMTDGDAKTALHDVTTALSTENGNAALWSLASYIDAALSQYVDADLAATNAAHIASDAAYTVDLLQFYADTRFGLGNGRAIAAATAALARFPASAPVAYQAGRIYGLVNQPTLSYYALQNALALDPTDPAPYVLLAQIAEGDGDFVQAALYLRTALALRPHGPDAAIAKEMLSPIRGLTV